MQSQQSTELLHSYDLCLLNTQEIKIRWFITIGRKLDKTILIINMGMSEQVPACMNMTVCTQRSQVMWVVAKAVLKRCS